MKKEGSLGSTIVALAVMALCSTSSVQSNSSQADQSSFAVDGTVHVPSFPLPLSSYMSNEAKQEFVSQQPRVLAFLEKWVNLASPDQQRRAMDDYFRPVVEQAKAAFPVH